MINKVNKNEAGPVIGERVKQVRTSRNLTLEQLSEQCEITEGHLRNIESGNRFPSVPVLIDLCNALKVSSDELLKPLLDINEEKINKETLLIMINELSERQVEILIDILQVILRL